MIMIITNYNNNANTTTTTTNNNNNDKHNNKTHMPMTGGEVQAPRRSRLNLGGATCLTLLVYIIRPRVFSTALLV